MYTHTHKNRERERERERKGGNGIGENDGVLCAGVEGYEWVPPADRSKAKMRRERWEGV